MRRIVVRVIVGALACGGCHAAGVPVAGDPEGPPIDGKAVCVPATRGSWAVDMIASPGLYSGDLGLDSSSTSLAARADGTAAITYSDIGVRGFLELAVRTPTAGWTRQDLSPFGQDTGGGDLAVVRLDRMGRPVIASARRSDFPSRVDVRLGDGTTTQIDATGATVYDLAMVLDGNDRPQVAFGRSDSGLFYGRWDGAAWQLEHIADGTVIDQALALDGDGRPSVLFTAHDQQWVELARRGDDGTWTIESVEPPVVGPCHQVSLAADSRGWLHATYVDWSKPDAPVLKYAVRSDSGWQLEPVSCTGPVALASMALDGFDRPHVAFAAPTKTGDFSRPTYIAAPLEYAVRGDRGWAIETVGGADEEDAWPSLVVGSDGQARVSFSEMTTGAVRYAERRE